jgi:hypothetical protein
MSAAKKELRPAVRAWIAALRSGEFQQGEGFLRLAEDHPEAPGMCCLGVAGELCRREHPDRLQWRLVEGADGYVLADVETGDESQQELIPFVMRWLGVEERDPSVYVPMGEAPLRPLGLAELNDDGSSFRVIADLIEHDADLGDGTNGPDPDPDEDAEGEPDELHDTDEGAV